jgi:hypothetical protein
MEIEAAWWHMRNDAPGSACEKGFSRERVRVFRLVRGVGDENLAAADHSGKA